MKRLLNGVETTVAAKGGDRDDQTKPAKGKRETR